MSGRRFQNLPDLPGDTELPEPTQTEWVGFIGFNFYPDGGINPDTGYTAPITVDLTARRIEELIAKAFDFPSAMERDKLLRQKSVLPDVAGEPQIRRYPNKKVRVTIEVLDDDAEIDKPDHCCTGEVG